MAQQGHTPKVASLELRSGCKWIVYGLTISPSFASTYSKKTLIEFASHSWTGPSWDCIAEACTAYSVPDASGWTREQWDTLSCNGMSIPGNRIVARDNHFKNVNFGISVTGDSCLVEHNIVESFAGDGLRGLGDYGTYQYNVIKNCYAVNINHDDGFQSWSLGDNGVGTGVVYGIILRGNTIINYEDINQPFRGTLQGIGCFDGMFEDWLVVNNVVITDHWHGISLYGATNCVIINNTVVDPNEERPGPPWIMISDHDNGTPSTGCFVRNNLATDFDISSQDVTVDHNIEIENYDDFFVNYPAGDLHLKEGCAAVDSGSPDMAPAIDRDGNPRPYGDGIDVGAYEYKPVSIFNKFKQYNNESVVVQFIYTLHSVILSLNNPRIDNIYIYDILGRRVHSTSLLGKRIIEWHTDKFGNGIYLIRLTSGGKNYFDKIVLMR
jgi:parallel beta-helix repeat protein